MKPALYMLGGVVAMVGFVAAVWLVIWGLTSLFGDLYGFIVFYGLIVVAMGSVAGWGVYRVRRGR